MQALKYDLYSQRNVYDADLAVIPEVSRVNVLKTFLF